ncbi:MAG: hypothetical protein ACRCZ9_05210 [Fusobacteriaceae bacterium]
MYKIAERNIYPVGHGGFHEEKIGEHFHFIFDCGSKNEKHLNDLIEKNFQNVQKIDLLVISHFHDDHYNGFLKLNIGRQIKKIMIPFLSKKEKLVNVLSYIAKISDEEMENYKEKINEVIKITSDSKKYLNERGWEGQLLIVNKHENKIRKTEDLALNDLQNKYGSYQIKSGQKLTLSISRNLKWVFIPFNLDSEDTEKEKEFLKSLSNLLEVKEEDLNLEILSKKLEQLKEKEQIEFLKNLKAIYDSILKKSKTNEYSLCIYSGPEKLKTPYILFEEEVGCLYTGDYRGKGKTLTSLKKAYNSVINDIGVIQIPHHGSINNYQSDYIFKNVKECFINSPEFNKRGWHPNKKVVEDIENQKCKLHILTEKSSTLKYNIYSVGNQNYLRFFMSKCEEECQFKNELIKLSARYYFKYCDFYNYFK